MTCVLPFDTTADARRVQLAAIRRMTPQERVRIAVAMYGEELFARAWGPASRE